MGALENEIACLSQLQKIIEKSGEKPPRQTRSAPKLNRRELQSLTPGMNLRQLELRCRGRPQKPPASASTKLRSTPKCQPARGRPKPAPKPPTRQTPTWNIARSRKSGRRLPAQNREFGYWEGPSAGGKTVWSEWKATPEPKERVDSLEAASSSTPCSEEDSSDDSDDDESTQDFISPEMTDDLRHKEILEGTRKGQRPELASQAADSDSRGALELSTRKDLFSATDDGTTDCQLRERQSSTNHDRQAKDNVLLSSEESYQRNRDKANARKQQLASWENLFDQMKLLESALDNAEAAHGQTDEYQEDSSELSTLDSLEDSLESML